MKAPPRPERLPCNEKCPKCGYSEIGMTFREKGKKYIGLYINDMSYWERDAGGYKVIKEHLDCNCQKCHHIFTVDVRKGE